MSRSKLTVCEYPIPLTSETFTLQVPQYRKILPGAVRVQAHGNNPQPVMCIEVDPETLVEPVNFHVIRTDKPLPETAKEYIGTFQTGWRVWHVYTCVQT